MTFVPFESTGGYLRLPVHQASLRMVSHIYSSRDAPLPKALKKWRSAGRSVKYWSKDVLCLTNLRRWDAMQTKMLHRISNITQKQKSHDIYNGITLCRIWIVPRQRMERYFRKEMETKLLRSVTSDIFCTCSTKPCKTH